MELPPVHDRLTDNEDTVPQTVAPFLIPIPVNQPEV